MGQNKRWLIYYFSDPKENLPISSKTNVQYHAYPHPGRDKQD